MTAMSFGQPEVTWVAAGRVGSVHVSLVYGFVGNSLARKDLDRTLSELRVSG